ncbi:hypothetical protein HNR40_008740 [Nonomuraea endophytica]|uniref:Uncharacterized protein n=1 Tax=Nonomuraea endophytica TaxID=714136 RepID=A0A7W8ABH8_9ACTN|nr:hypothetical protein [Nonomuraea endophytica]
MSAPHSVRTAAGLWLTAVALGAVETAIAVSGLLISGEASVGELAGGLGLRLAIYAAAIYLALALRRGKNWARLTLTATLGVFGTISLVIEPIRYFMAGGGLSAALYSADAAGLAMGASRVLHLAAVLGAVTLMFQRSANDYFAGNSGARRLRTPGERRAAAVDTTTTPAQTSMADLASTMTARRPASNKPSGPNINDPSAS